MSVNIIRQQYKRSRKVSPKIRKEVKSRVVGYVTAAFALVAGLAWDEAIRALLEYLFPIDRSTMLAKFIYAGAMTFILVVVSVYLIKIFHIAEVEKEKEKKKEQKEEIVKVEKLLKK